MRISQQRLPPSKANAGAGADDDGGGISDSADGSERGSSFGSSAASAASTALRRVHPRAEYSPGSECIEIWFKNECRLVPGLTHWGAYSYGRWWKGLAARYLRTPDVDDRRPEVLAASADRFVCIVDASKRPSRSR